MRPSESKRRNDVKIALVMSLLLNVGLFYWTMTLGTHVNTLVRENQRLAGDLAGIKQQNDMLQNQLSYYKTQADYYSKIFRTGTTQDGLVGISSVNTVAVEQIEQGPFTVSYKGVVLNLLVELRKGEGRLLVNSQPKVGIDLQTSGRTAVLVAQNVTRLSMMNTDVIVTVTADWNVETVDGPSAGAAITLAIIAAVRNQTLRKDVFVSGTINPNQTIGPVGGLEYKAVAAAEKGAAIFLVPKGQSVVTVYKPVELTSTQGVRVIAYEITKVDLESLLKERGYRVTVAEVSTIQEAYLIFTR